MCFIKWVWPLSHFSSPLPDLACAVLCWTITIVLQTALAGRREVDSVLHLDATISPPLSCCCCLIHHMYIRNKWTLGLYAGCVQVYLQFEYKKPVYLFPCKMGIFILYKCSVCRVKDYRLSFSCEHCVVQKQIKFLDSLSNVWQVWYDDWKIIGPDL